MEITGTIFGMRDAKVENSSSSQTTKVTVYNIGNGNFYVNTPGFDNSDENKNDDETAPTASFKREAKFIESLARDYDSNVWDNTIIVTKGDKIENGPREAAKEIAKSEYDKKKEKCDRMTENKNDLLAKTSDFAILLFESLPSINVYVEGNFTSDQLNRFNIFKESEPGRILAKYNLLMNEHSMHLIKINFKKVKCLNCPKETDPRLAISECHLEAESFHPETVKIHLYKIIHVYSNNLDEYHPGLLKAYHPGSYMPVHSGVPIDTQINYNPGECFIHVRVFIPVAKIIIIVVTMSMSIVVEIFIVKDAKSDIIAAMDLAQNAQSDVHQVQLQLKLQNVKKQLTIYSSQNS
ncbi:15601_t:CDS:2, partial [Racocetra persica]